MLENVSTFYNSGVTKLSGTVIKRVLSAYFLFSNSNECDVYLQINGKGDIP